MAREPIKILLVDDAPQNLVALEAVIRRPGCEVVTARSGEEALRFLLKNDCALILLDVRMPGIDGFETARLVRENDRTRPIPIVFLTSATREERSVLRGYEAGAVDFLTKPVDPDILRAKVAAFVELHRAKQEIARQAALLREHERTERQRILAELELRSLRRQQAAQERYRRLVSGITNAIVWTIDPATLACTFASPSAEAILGYAQHEWSRTPESWRALIPHEERSRLVDAVRSLKLDGESISIRHGFIASDGHIARFQTELSLVPGDEESGAQVRGFSVDLTQLVRAEEELAFLDRAGADLSNSLDLEATTATVGRIPLPYLADWCAVEVVSPAEGDPPLTSVVHADERCMEDAQRLAAALSELPESPGGAAEIVRDLAVRLGAAGGAAVPLSVLPTSMLIVPLRARGRSIGSVRLFRCGGGAPYGPHELRIAAELGRRASHAIDNALLYREAREAVRVRDEFLSIASHELRTPLTPLSLQTDAIERIVASQLPDAGLRTEILRRLATCGRQVDRMTQLVKNLLDVSRLRAGRLDLQREDCDLRELTSDITARFQEDLFRSGRRIDLDVDGPVRGVWDRSRLDQVVTNLVSNAVRYGGKKPIAVGVRCHATHATLTVSDQGPGIDERDLGRIFERFERGETSRSHGGLGLGLYIARRIVEAHGGSVTARSKLGEGSTFEVELPLDPPPASDREATAAAVREHPAASEPIQRDSRSCEPAPGLMEGGPSTG